MRLYAEWVKKMLESRGHVVTVIRPPAFFARLSSHTSVRKNLGYIDKFVLFPLRLVKVAKHYDLVHVLDHSNSMYLRLISSPHKLITCHDLLAIRAARGDFPQASTGWSGRLLQRWILSGLRFAEHAICVSEKTARDLQDLTGQDCPEIVVIHHTLNCDYKSGASLSDGVMALAGLKAGEQYLIHVGGNSWYKNRIGVLRIFAHFVKLPEYTNYRLVMVGLNWTSKMRTFVRENGLSGRVTEALGIGPSALKELYCNASALIFPSLEEGFGWPVLEAQACGCPVVTTGRPPMTEVAGEAAVFIDPHEPDRAAEAITIAIRRGEALRAAGFRNLERFNEAKVAARYMDLYETIAAECWSSSSSPAN
ncbi:MAG: glycosyltransferase family 4 protein [Acidobacteria bacterium]|nr:glycosyltransferase family 4 protein [Acidobacteriota bacterium]